MIGDWLKDRLIGLGGANAGLGSSLTGLPIGVEAASNVLALGLLMVASSRSLLALALRLRMKMMAAAAMRPRITAPPTAMPAMAPVARVEDDLEPRVYLRLKSSEVITLTEAPADGIAVGGWTGLDGVVKQGVSPSIVEEYTDHPLS